MNGDTRGEARSALDAPAEVEHVSHRGGGKTGRRCRTCLRTDQTFASSRARRCEDCTARMQADSWCRGCGVKIPLNSRGELRYYCGDPDCRLPELPSTCTCVACGVEKPRTLEHFPPSRRRRDGVVVTQTTCRLCTQALARDRYASDEEWRRKTLERSAAAHARNLQRRAEDPEFNEQFLRHQRLTRQARQARAAAASVEGAEGAEVSSKTKQGALPGQPVAAMLRAFARRANRPLLDVCDMAGLLDRRVRAWETGERASLGLVDQLLVRFGLNWWDIFDPRRWGPLGMTPLEWIDAVDEAAFAFEGERLL